MKEAAVDVVEIPEAFANMAERRCAAILRRSMADWRDGKLEMLIRSCYLQGVQDGFQAAEHERTRGDV